MIVINFKNYVYGKKSLELSKKIQKYLPNSIVTVPAVDIETISEKTKLSVYGEHVDYLESGRNTGFLVPEAIKSAGAKGTLVNHSEHKLSISDIEKTLVRCKKVGLKVIICSGSIKETKKILKLKEKPMAIAFEDPKLIGSGKSVTQFNPKDVVRFSKLLEGTGIIPLCGAGISNAKDVEASNKLGCKGVLIASAIANVKSPEKILKEISRVA